MVMCKGMEEYTLKVTIEAAIKAYRCINMTDDEIVQAIVKNFEVTAEYVKYLMEATPA